MFSAHLFDQREIGKNGISAGDLDRLLRLGLESRFSRRDVIGARDKQAPVIAVDRRMKVVRNGFDADRGA